MEGSLSVLSTPTGISGMFSGYGMSMIEQEAVVLERNLDMNGRLTGVVKMVTVTRGRRRRS